MSEEPQAEIKQEPEAVAFSEFLERIPPSQSTRISRLVQVKAGSPSWSDQVITKPEIQLHCPHDACNGTGFFRCTTPDEIVIPDDRFRPFYLHYICSNCQSSRKTFSLGAKMESGSKSGDCFKFGEAPAYGPPTPSRLIKLVGLDREMFLRGRRCENQGLGIGAFVYYRRVVENQKNRILDEIIKVSRKLGVDTKIITTLEAAKEETQFSKALESVKDAVPQALLINGHNPLTLLHSALSDGLHDRTDERCLEIASSVRVVLVELSERLAQALKDEAQLNSALSKLLGAKNNT